MFLRTFEALSTNFGASWSRCQELSWRRATAAAASCDAAARKRKCFFCGPQPFAPKFCGAPQAPWRGSS
eukprot:8266570-Pyramimonas_sp.AAC.1